MINTKVVNRLASDGNLVMTNGRISDLPTSFPAFQAGAIVCFITSTSPEAAKTGVQAVSKGETINNRGYRRLVIVFQNNGLGLDCTKSNVNPFTVKEIRVAAKGLLEFSFTN